MLRQQQPTKHLLIPDRPGTSRRRECPTDRRRRPGRKTAPTVRFKMIYFFKLNTFSEKTNNNPYSKLKSPDITANQRSGLGSEPSTLLQFLEKCQAAQAGLPFPVLPQDQQVVRGARDQAVLPEAHKHLTEEPKRLLKRCRDAALKQSTSARRGVLPELPPSVQSGHPSAPAS